VTPVYDADVPTAIRRAVLGLGDSISACQHWMSAGDTDKVYINSVQAIMWICALDDLFGLDDVGGAPYAESRAEHHDGNVVEALRFARDKGVHQLAAFHEAVPRLSRGPVLGPGYPDGSYAVWLRSEDVLLRAAKRPSDIPKMKRHDELLAGRAVWGTLIDAYGFLLMQSWAKFACESPPLA
jgi:hypothetical protein